MKRRIHIDRDGLTLVGDLFVPDAFDEGGSYPAVVVQGSFSSVKEQMPDSYAARFAAQGFVALSFDYAHYGQSDGQPRQFESPDEKLQDLKAAVTYLLEQPFVSAVGMVGVCTSASNGVYLAAEDARLKGFATIAGFLADAGMFKATYGVDGIARRLEEAAAAWRAFEHSGTATTIPVYSETDLSAVNYNPRAGAYDYYTNPGRGNVPEYVNAFDVRSWDGWLGLDPLGRIGIAGQPAGTIRGAWYPYTFPFNLTGHPALSMSCGRSPAGLPIGLQLVAGWHADRYLLDVATRLRAALPAPNRDELDQLRLKAFRDEMNAIRYGCPLSRIS